MGRRLLNDYRPLVNQLRCHGRANADLPVEAGLADARGYGHTRARSLEALVAVAVFVFVVILVFVTVPVPWHVLVVVPVLAYKVDRLAAGSVLLAVRLPVSL